MMAKIIQTTTQRDRGAGGRGSVGGGIIYDGFSYKREGNKL